METGLFVILILSLCLVVIAMVIQWLIFRKVTTDLLAYISNNTMLIAQLRLDLNKLKED